MSKPTPSNEDQSKVPGQFMLTRWSLVGKVADPANPAYSRAMTEFYKAYWYPLYAFTRRSGQGKEASEDLIQGFFLNLIEKDWLSRADQEKGRLRTFLLTFLKRYMRDEWKKETAVKRGGGKTESLDVLRFDVEFAENRYASEPVDEMTPDRLYQRRWALTVLENSLKALEQEEIMKRRGDRFSALRPYLGFSAMHIDDNYAATAEKLDLPVGTVKSEVSRLRARWNAILKGKVAETLDTENEDEIKAELGELFSSV